MHAQYIVTIGKYYYCGDKWHRADRTDVFLTSNIRKTSLFNIVEAKDVAKEYGGKIYKINLELEEL